MRKIAICGASKVNKEIEIEDCKKIGRELAELGGVEEVVLATGGTLGLPFEIVREAKKLNPKIYVEAYTPCRDKREWDEYTGVNLAPPRDFYDEIFYTDNDGEIFVRALQRIPLLLKDSMANIAHVNQYAGNTYVEIFSSRGLSIPTLVLASDEAIEKSVKELSHPEHVKVFSCSWELIKEIRKL